MKKYLLFVLLLIAGALTTIAQDEVKRYELNVGPFSSLRVIDKIDVVYACNPDSAGFVVFEAPQDMADMLMFHNSKGKLTIQVATEVVGNPDLPTIYVYSEYLQYAENGSDSTLRIMSVAPISEFKLKLSGNGRIVAHGLKGTTVSVNIVTGNGLIIVDGECNTAKLGNLGTGEIQADRLVAKDVECKLIGTGTIGCNVSDKLVVKGTGTGKVYYKGKPKEYKKYHIGPIKVIPLDEQEATI